MGTSAVLLSVSTWKFPNSILSGSLVECMYIVVFGGFGHTVTVCKGREPGSYNTEVTLASSAVELLSFITLFSTAKACPRGRKP